MLARKFFRFLALRGQFSMYNNPMTKKRLSGVIATQEAVDRFRELFRCKRCGACCTKFEGVKITREEAECLPVPAGGCLDLYEVEGGSCYLKQPCRFYDAAIPGCSIYDERPQTCRSFPIHNARCDDGRVHLGITETCMAAVEALEELEMEYLER